MQAVKLSPYVHLFPQQKALGLFHTLRVSAAFVPYEVMDNGRLDLSRLTCENALEVMDTETVNALTNLGMVVPLGCDDSELLQQLRRDVVDGVEISLMYMLLTERCNLRCRYCFMMSPQMIAANRKEMTLVTAQNALDAFSKWVSHDYDATIQLYGGEPLLNMGALRHIVGKTDEMIGDGRLPEHTKVAIVCNGTMITSEFVKLVMGNGDLISVAVSMDGPAPLNDTWRVKSDGSGAYADALRGYMLMKDAGLAPGLSVTLPFSSLSHMSQIVSWVLELDPNGLSFNTITDIVDMPMNEQYANHVATAMIEAFVQFRQAGIYEDRMMRKVTSITGGKTHVKDCCGYGQQIVVASDGSLGVCHGYADSRGNFVANVNDLGDFNPHADATFLEWGRRSPLNMPQCQDCPALGICGGGCAYNADTRHGSIWEKDDVFCPHALHSLSWLMTEMYNQLGL